MMVLSVTSWVGNGRMIARPAYMPFVYYSSKLKRLNIRSGPSPSPPPLLLLMPTAVDGGGGCATARDL